jgi:UDP-glucose 4-epimerase
MVAAASEHRAATEGQPMNNHRYLVTGGAGFIGSELVRQLAPHADRLTIVDNLVNGTRENVEEVLDDHIQLVVADVRDNERMAGLMHGADVVFHLACLGVRHSIHSPLENHQVNADATLRLLMAARESGVGRFVCVSSSEVYGTARRAPMDEDHPTFPMTVYGSSKLAGECYARAFFQTYRYPTVVVRPFNAYGPRCHHEGDCGEVIPKFMLRCLAGEPMIIFGDGSQTRDFTYVSDTAAGITLAGLSPEAVGQTINLGSGAEIKIADLAREVASAAGRPGHRITYAEARPGDVLRLFADTSLARRLLGYRPKVPMSEGLTRLREWYAARTKSPEELLSQEVVHNWQGQSAEVCHV